MTGTLSTLSRDSFIECLKYLDPHTITQLRYTSKRMHLFLSNIEKTHTLFERLVISQPERLLSRLQTPNLSQIHISWNKMITLKIDPKNKMTSKDMNDLIRLLSVYTLPVTFDCRTIHPIDDRKFISEMFLKFHEQDTLFVNNVAYVTNTIFGRSAFLILACQDKILSLALFLISLGANINYKDYRGETPLSIAEKEQDQDLIFLLKKHGACS